MENKLNYYVFLDIDGTLWDAEYAFRVHGFAFNTHPTPRLKPESVNALNLLLRSLEASFDTKLIITSKRRHNLNKCVDYLKDNGLDYNKPIFCTDNSTDARGKKILDFMKENGSVPCELPPNANLWTRLQYAFSIHGNPNYVVLEDEKNLVRNQIPRNRIIYTDHNKQSLTVKQVEQYLKRNGFALQNNPEQNQPE